MAKKKRSKRETIRGMSGGLELDPALWAHPDPEAERPEARDEETEEQAPDEADSDDAGGR
jgi:hypothetical protein